MTKNLVERYQDKLTDEHAICATADMIKTGNKEGFLNVPMIDTLLRNAIGKTDDIRVALCSHKAILNRELPLDYCRQCNKKIKPGQGRFNDFLVLRHPHCFKPICAKCAVENPDKFYLAFKKGVDKLKAGSIAQMQLDAIGSFADDYASGTITKDEKNFFNFNEKQKDALKVVATYRSII